MTIKVLRFPAVLVLSTLSPYCASAYAAELSPNEQNLLRGLIALRNDTLQRCSQGKGQVVATTEMKGEREETSLPSKIDFVFSGNRAVYFWHLPSSDKCSVEGVVVGDAEARYSTGLAPKTMKGVTVQPLYPYVEAVPIKWYFADIARIPGKRSDLVYLDWLCRNGFTKASRAENLLAIDVTHPAKEKDDVIEITSHFVFDLTLGGMLCKFRSRQVTLEDKLGSGKMQRVEIDEEWNTTWESDESGLPKPVSRKSQQSITVAGKLKSRYSENIQFSNIVYCPVSREEVSLSALNIPVGTWVFDQIQGVQWQYFKGADWDIPQTSTRPATQFVKLAPMSDAAKVASIAKSEKPAATSRRTVEVPVSSTAKASVQPSRHLFIWLGAVLGIVSLLGMYKAAKQWKQTAK